MKYFIKTGLKVKLESSKFIPGSCDFQIGGVLADNETSLRPGLGEHSPSDTFPITPPTTTALDRLYATQGDDCTEIRLPSSAVSSQFFKSAHMTDNETHEIS